MSNTITNYGNARFNRVWFQECISRSPVWICPRLREACQVLWGPSNVLCVSSLYDPQQLFLFYRYPYRLRASKSTRYPVLDGRARASGPRAIWLKDAPHYRTAMRYSTVRLVYPIHSVDATAFESIFFFIECTTFKPTESTRRETGWLLVRQKQPGVKLDVYLSLTLFRVRFRWSLSRLYRDCLGVSPREGLMYEVGTDDYYVSDYFKSPHFESGWERLFAQLRESFSRVSDFFRWRRRPTFRLPLSGERPLQDLFEFLCECHTQHVMSTTRCLLSIGLWLSILQASA